LKTALIIGGGFGGCAACHQLNLQGGWDVTIVEASSYLGAGVRTFWHGGHPYTYGPRHFLTRKEELFEFINKYIPIRLITNDEYVTYIERDNAFYNFPIHRDDVALMPDREKIEAELSKLTGVEAAKNFEEYWVGSVGRTLYDKFVDGYSKKMWMIDNNNEIDTFNWSPKGAALKEGPRQAWDTAISGYPYAEDGYNQYFDISTEGATILFNTIIENYDIPNKTVTIDGQSRQFDIIVSTISPDELFGKCYGELAYVGRDFHKIVFPTEHIFPENVYFQYYANDEKFTRLVEYKKFTRHESPTTLVGMEIPSKNGKFYPVPKLSEFKLAERYFSEMPDGVFSLARNGSYRYGIDIDNCIEQAIWLVDMLKQGGRDHAVPGRTQDTILDT
jgi:UDP-galactopyranose mutase